MTNLEFSIEFDVLYNNVDSNRAAGLNAYEKSVFLTQAEEDLVKDLYAGRVIDSFENTEENRSYLNNLIKTQTYSVKEASEGTLTDKSKVFTIDEDVWFKTYEAVNLKDDKLCGGASRAAVLPVTQDAFERTYRSPFRGPSEKRVLRLDLADNKVELVSSYNIESYLLRYLRKPNPIVLETFDNGLSVNGISEETPCELHDNLHREILKRAVILAKQAWLS